MARHLFGGSAADVAEDITGARVPNASGTVWDGPGSGAIQLIDLTDLGGSPIQGLTSDSQGMIGQFYGPDGVDTLWVDFGSGRVILTPTDVAEWLDEHETADDPHGIKGWAEAMFSGGGQTMTVEKLLQDQVFYAAHRGSGLEAPEHTMEAYEYAVASGATAIEVSVQATADGTLVCMHDTDMTRVFGVAGSVNTYAYSAARNTLKPNPSDLLGAGWGPQKLTPLRNVLDRFLGKVVIFLEPKTNDASAILTGGWLMNNYPSCASSVVWKTYYNNATKQWAQDKGMKTWAYIDATTAAADMDTYDANVDYWGVPHTSTDAKVAEVVARGKPVIVWEVARRSDRDRFAGLGVRGMMTPSIHYIKPVTQIIPRDNWKSQVKAPGDIGLENYDGKFALKYDGTGIAYFDFMDRASCLMGAVSIPTFPANGYRVSFDMKYDVVPASTLHAGIAFGKVADDKYRFSEINTSGGYHVAIRGGGDIQVYSHNTTVPNGTVLAQGTASKAPVAGQWMSFQVDLTPTQIILRRTDLTPVFQIASNDTTYRGGYVHLSGGSVVDPTQKPKWRNFSITAL
ncbi:glycerophosphodiester phosphodiesterase [Streptomyces sp. NBC_01197]|uniref:glycerophosphodiester phosphodiesterase n=1 Tax=Streptomyces sp. NBC_01197 TaxID=2903768 RepID=UPI002E1402AA|nr:glycerophosphodiester phosphodiesterase [Streptomyces sp. NBC_01197]